MSTKVFQVIDLDSEKMDKEKDQISKKERAKLIPPGVAESLIRALKKSGYDVLWDGGTNNGIPTSLIVVGELPAPVKSDFARIIKSLGLNGEWFRSGKAYYETPSY